MPSTDAVQNGQAVLSIDDDCPVLQRGNHSSSPNRRHLIFRVCLLLCDELRYFVIKIAYWVGPLPDAYRFQVEQLVLSDRCVIHRGKVSNSAL
jgi:hypothetical protein